MSIVAQELFGAPVVGVEFHLPGTPHPERKRQFGKFRADTSQTHDYKQRVSIVAGQVMAGRAVMEGPLEVIIIAMRLKPQSAAKKVWAPTTRPDVDNYVKVVCDGCNKVVWRDDAQIVELRAFKVFGRAEGLTVIVNALHEWDEEALEYAETAMGYGPQLAAEQAARAAQKGE